MITLEQNHLVFRFPEVHPKAEFSLCLQRTLRIPDDGRDHYLPPGLGAFPLRHIDDYVERVPEAWRRRGGVLMPMYQAEAMWLSFSSGAYPFALKVATGKINAVTGAPWSTPLRADPQDYLVVPGQPWLDGYCVEKGIIRQFVAAPMGKGITVEEQLTGEATWGGIQLIAFPMTREKFAELEARRKHEPAFFLSPPAALHETTIELGLAAGGRMRQHIYEDEHGLDAWDQEHGSRCFISIVNSEVWTKVTGEPMPTQPIDAQAYSKAGLPWFDYYSEAPALGGSATLQGVKSIAETWKDDTQPELDFTAPANPSHVVALGRRPVHEGE